MVSRATTFLASGRGRYAAIGAVATVAGLALAFADSDHRVLGLAVILGGVLVISVAWGWVKLSVAAVQTALAHGAVEAMPSYAPVTPGQLLAMLLTVQGELEHNLDFLDFAYDNGYYWSPNSEGMWPGEWNRARAIVGQYADLVTLYQATDRAHFSMRRVHVLASRPTGLIEIGPDGSHRQRVQEIDALDAVIGEVQKALALVTAAVDERRVG